LKNLGRLAMMIFRSKKNDSLIKSALMGEDLRLSSKDATMIETCVSEKSLDKLTHQYHVSDSLLLADDIKPHEQFCIDVWTWLFKNDPKYQIRRFSETLTDNWVIFKQTFPINGNNVKNEANRMGVPVKGKDIGDILYKTRREFYDDHKPDVALVKVLMSMGEDKRN
jgi:hypothetical protein